MNETQTRTLADRIEEDSIGCTVRSVPRNPGMVDMPIGSSHWFVKMIRQGKPFSVTFSMGPAHKGRLPTTEEVLECVLDDASGAEESFENWCADLGFDSDSRRAERLYKACVAQTSRLRAWLGDDFDSYVYETDFNA